MILMRNSLQDAYFHALFEGVKSPYLVLDIRRDHIVRDAIVQIDLKESGDLHKQLRIQFSGEEAVDEGGVQKEFFQLLMKSMFKEDYGKLPGAYKHLTCI
jgi:hypothetical protein